VLNDEVLALELPSGNKVSDIINSSEGIIFFIIPKFVNVTSQIELKCINEIYSEFQKNNWEAIIVTADDQESLDNYISNSNSKLQIYHDTNLKLCTKLDLLGDNKLPLKRTVVVDSKHHIKKVFKNVIPKEHPREVLKWVLLNDQNTISVLEKGISIQ
jgi:peroxiredoxin